MNIIFNCSTENPRNIELPRFATTLGSYFISRSIVLLNEAMTNQFKGRLLVNPVSDNNYTVDPAYDVPGKDLETLKIY